MTKIAGAIIILAGVVCAAGAMIADGVASLATNRTPMSFGMGYLIGFVLGLIGLFTLRAGFASRDRE